jgi:hypothetical protein
MNQRPDQGKEQRSPGSQQSQQNKEVGQPGGDQRKPGHQAPPDRAGQRLGDNPPSE